MRIFSLPVEFLQQLMVKIVNKEPMLEDIEFDWMLLEQFRLLGIDKVFQ